MLRAKGLGARSTPCPAARVCVAIFLTDADGRGKLLSHPPPLNELAPLTPCDSRLTGQVQIAMTSNEIANLGTGLAALMSTAQLEAAVALYSTISTATESQNTISIAHVRRAFYNHLKACVRMPAGGANAKGSMQTGFEMEMMSALGVGQLMKGWPNHETKEGGRRQSWELRSMEELATHLELETESWGALQGRPMAIPPGKETHAGVILISPPFTVSWGTRVDGTTWTCVRFPIVLWTEEDAIILPPDDSEGQPFYQDPIDQPGMHRDLFKTWARRVAGELLVKGFPMSRDVKTHLPLEYLSDGSPMDDNSDSDS